MAETPPPGNKDASYYATLQRLWLDQWAKDQNEGITARALHQKLAQHIDADSVTHSNLGQRVAALENDAKRDAEDRQAEAFAELGTGRYHAIATPPPFQAPPMAITVNASSGSGSNSHRPRAAEKSFWTEALKKPAARAVSVVLLVVLSAVSGCLSRHLLGRISGLDEEKPGHSTVEH